MMRAFLHSSMLSSRSEPRNFFRSMFYTHQHCMNGLKIPLLKMNIQVITNRQSYQIVYRVIRPVTVHMMNVVRSAMFINWDRSMHTLVKLTIIQRDIPLNVSSEMSCVTEPEI